MFTHSRDRSTPIEHQMARRADPEPGGRKLVPHGLRLLLGALITIGLIGVDAAIPQAVLAAQPPIGYERWTHPNTTSGVDFGLTVTQVYDKYAASLHLAMPAKHKRKDKRLIDIEVRADGSGLANYVYDAVWVKDEGNLALESWFVPGLTETELHELPLLAELGIVMVDIERYPEGQEWRFSAILQRNAGKFASDVLTDASLDQVLDAAARQGLRVVDLDYAHQGPLDCPTAPGQACAPASFDAVLVANSGSNAVETRLWLNMTPEQMASKQAQGYQVIDREFGNESSATVWVKPGLPFDLQDSLTEHAVIHEHGHQGRVVDLEHSPAPYSIVNLAGSAAPPSPNVAEPRKGDTDDERKRVKPRSEKAKAKLERDRKAKNKKTGRQGKHGKGRRR